PFIGAKHAKQPVDLVVVRLYVVVPDGPVVAKAVDAFAFKIFRAEPQRYSAPVVGTTSQHACAPPLPVGTFGLRIRLTVDFPTPVTTVEIAEGAELRGSTPPGRFPWVA